MSSKTESFSADGVLNYINEFDECLAEIKASLKVINDEVDKTLQVNENSSCGLYGDVGRKLKEIWIDNSTSGNDACSLLETWSTQLKSIYNTNNATASEVSNIYQEKA
ncbi:MAG TPA: hypothetical protein DCE23_00145 [Firmicutes bacterium]|nr:hypothetical protein [Bacillota bacterium]